MANRPTSAVFTTVLWDGGLKIADFNRHITRLKQHAERLRIVLPEYLEREIATCLNNVAEKFDDIQLLNITYNAGEQKFIVKPRQLPTLRNCDIHAMALPLTKWLGRITGTKHGDWQPYISAQDIANQRGADIALLVDDYCIVDSDRAGLMVIDEDGVAYITNSEKSVQSITLDIITEAVRDMGVPLVYAKLNERLVARSSEILALGVGLGCCRILSIDGEEVGQNDSVIWQECEEYLAQHYSNTDNWVDLCRYLN